MCRRKSGRFAVCGPKGFGWHPVGSVVLTGRIMKTLRPDWRAIAQNRFNHLLTLLGTMFLISPFLMSDDGLQFDPIVSVAMLASVIGITRAVISNNRQFYGMLALILASSLVDLVAHYGYFDGSRMAYGVVARFAQVLLITVVVVRLMQWLFRVESVDADTIKGGICVYLLLGFQFVGLYRLAYALNAEAFSRSFTNGWELVYFSFTTLTTVGYGDITPRLPFAMMLTNLEGIVGQLFLTVFVARLVGLHIVHHTKSG